MQEAEKLLVESLRGQIEPVVAKARIEGLLTAAQLLEQDDAREAELRVLIEHIDAI